MVNWVGDGMMSGYDPSTNKLSKYLYHFASPGTVDLNGITRFQYAAYGVKESNYPNRLFLKGTLSFVTGDFTAHPDRWLVLGAFLAPASRFSDGQVPTPQQILNVGYDKLGWTYSEEEAGSTGSHDFTIEGWRGENLNWGEKYWVLLVPCFYNADLEVPIRPMKNITVNTMGRAMSFWTNRKPNKPVITSPVSGLTVAAGSTFQFTYDPNDPDAVVGGRFDQDLAGVQVAYAPLPDPGNTDEPIWRTLPYVKGNGARTTTSVHMWSPDVLPGDDRINLLDDLGFPVIFGDEFPTTPGRAGLPAGSWQIKVRTADYGHPYPVLFNSPSSKFPGGWEMNNIPSANRSEWSDPVIVNVFQQVPAPIPLSPINATAVPEVNATRLVWQYRNTADPPFPQNQRTVQIKKARESDDFWRTIRDNQKSNSTHVDLPAGFTTAVAEVPNLTPDELVNNGGFEVSGNTGGWQPVNLALTPTNVSGSPGAGVHTGTRALALTGSSNIVGGFYKEFNIIDDGHNLATLHGWARMNPDLGPISISLGWKDSNGDVIGSADEGTLISGYSMEPPSGIWDGVDWRELDLSIKRPHLAVSLLVSIACTSADVGVLTPAEWIRIDDVSVLTSYAEPEIPDLTIQATTEYVWRVKVSDTDFTPDFTDYNRSAYSQPAHWWSVSGANTGATKEIAGDSIEGATLGCGTHRAFIYRRGGLERVGEITGLMHVDWGRVRDDISTAQIVVQKWDIDCGNLLASLQTWAYELHLYRDNGYSVDRVWEGPISLITYEAESVTIDAKDAMNWMYRRIIRQTMNDSISGGDTVTSRATRILQNAFAIDDPNVLAYLQPIYNPSDAREYRNIPAYSRTAFEEIDDMAANSGLDYTVVGRAILVWGTKNRIGTLPEFRDKDLGASPIVSEYGMSMANVYAISDGNGVWGQASRLTETDPNDADNSGGGSEEDPVYGIIEMLSSTWAADSPEDSGIYTQEGLNTVRRSFEEHAERSIADRYPPPVVVRVPDNTTLNPSTVISIQQLVPGVVVPLRSTGTLRTVVADQKLDSVKVVEENGKEVVTITLSPFSQEDVATEGDTGL